MSAKAQPRKALVDKATAEANEALKDHLAASREARERARTARLDAEDFALSRFEAVLEADNVLTQSLTKSTLAYLDYISSMMLQQEADAEAFRDLVKHRTTAIFLLLLVILGQGALTLILLMNHVH